MSFLILQQKNRIGTVTLNRPEKRNALNSIVVKELREAFSQYEHNDEIKVIILRANGKVFSAGADLQYLQKLQTNSFEENKEDSDNLKDLYLQIYQSSKVVVAEVQGHAIAGGCGLMTVCDFAFAAPEAKFGYTEVKIGFIPAIVMVFLLRKLNEAFARELLIGGQLIGAARAYEMGLLNKVVPKEDLSTFTEDFAANLTASNSYTSMKSTKNLIAQVQGMDLENALSLAVSTNAKFRETDDCRKGIAAFLNGEEVTW